MVVLVKKVLDTAEDLTSKQEESKEAIDKFYSIATYCKITYLKKYA